MSQRVCLVTEVKNEAAVIRRLHERCIAAGVEYCYVMLDDKTTDNTEQVLLELGYAGPGDAAERDFIYEKHRWVDFGANKSLAIARAKLLFDVDIDWLLFLDADDIIEGKIPDLTGKAEQLNVLFTYGDLQYRRPLLVRSEPDWYFDGAVYETLASRTPVTKADIDGFHVVRGDGGADHRTTDGDIATLMEDYWRAPSNTRTVFYLGQTYKYGGDVDNAVLWYRLRVSMGGWAEEAWYSQYMVGELLGDPEELIKAWVMRPWRAEPLHRAAFIYRNRGEHARALAWSSLGMALADPSNDTLFIHDDVYSHQLQFEFSAALANNAWWKTAFYARAQRENMMLLDKELPEEYLRSVRYNVDWIAKQGAVATTA